MSIITAAALRQRIPDLRSPDLVSDGELDELVTDFAGIIERARGWAPVPVVDATFVVAGCHEQFLRLPVLDLTAVSEVSIDGTDIDVDEVTVWADGRLERSAGWWGDQATAVVTYGRPTASVGVVRACRRYVFHEVMTDLQPPTSNAFMTQRSEVDGTNYTERLGSADWDAGRFTGWTDVDQLINQLEDLRPSALGVLG